MSLFFVALPFACFGLYLMFSFCVLRFSGCIEEFEVVGFQKKTDKGRVLPIVRYEDGEEGVRLIEIRRIEQISYLLSPAIEKQTIYIANVTGQNPCVFGYLKLLSGLTLLLPALVFWAVGVGKGFLFTQAFFLLVFIGVMLGGWVLLKFIQRH